MDSRAGAKSPPLWLRLVTQMQKRAIFYSENRHFERNISILDVVCWPRVCKRVRWSFQAFLSLRSVTWSLASCRGVVSLSQKVLLPQKIDVDDSERNLSTERGETKKEGKAFYGKDKMRNESAET